jgi:hypothetical protein
MTFWATAETAKPKLSVASIFITLSSDQVAGHAGKCLPVALDATGRDLERLKLATPTLENSENEADISGSILKMQLRHETFPVVVDSELISAIDL